MSSGREPIASPPGSATLARLHRPTSGPSTQTEARNCRTAAKSASYFGSSGEVIRTMSPSSSTVAPSPRSTSAISGTSRMSGQLVMVVVPSASRLAAISFSTLFLAPPTATSPDNRLPPVTTNRSLTPVSVVSASSSVSSPRHGLPEYRLTHGRSPDPHLHPNRRRRHDRAQRLLPGAEERRAAGRLRRLRRDQRRHRASRSRWARPTSRSQSVLRQIQNDLFDAGADLSTPGRRESRVPAAADHPGLHRPAGGLVRRVQRAAAAR